MKNQLNENHKKVVFFGVGAVGATFANNFLTLNMILKFFVIMKERKDI
ncbi:hypothetical protein [Clostridioides difficile]